MGRPRTHASNAERQHTYRERERRLELFQGLPFDAASCRTESQYIRWHHAAAQVEGERRGETGELLQQRIERAEGYARRRWAGVRCGEIAAL